MGPQYYAIHKPFGVLSQFSNEGIHPGLLHLKLGLPKDVYPVGRLDRDSEGLLLLTNDNRFKANLTDPDEAHARIYWVQVEGSPTAADLHAFERPMELTIRKKPFVTAPAHASLLENMSIEERNPPIRFRKSVPTAWIELTIREGKNRQVRKMTAHAGFPTLRLMRIAIGQLQMSALKLSPGQCQELSKEEAFRALVD